jgi:Fe(3+) dicitrate transport protein
MKYALQILLYLSFSITYAQNGTVIGAVKDAEGKVLPNAYIFLDNHKLGTESDSQGKFLIKNVPAGNHVIHFSAVGYAAQSSPFEIKPGETVEINFAVEQKVELLGEVQVNGIKSITGMGYLAETNDGVIYSGKKTEVLLLDSLNANTAQNNPREVLGRVPGANYSETEYSGFPANGIGFRGLTPTQSVETNTRQNGYNITADLYGYPESYYLPPLEAVQRIEVTRGASSLQFGPQFGGVINYIIKRGPTNKPFEFTTQQTAGSFGFFSSFNAAGGQIGKFNYYTFVQAQTIQGWRPNSDVQKLTGFARVEYQASEKIKIGLEYTMLRNRIHMAGGLSDSLLQYGMDKSYRARNWLKSPWNILTATLKWKFTPSTTLCIKSSYNNSARDLVWRNEDGGPNASDAIDPLTNQYVNREVEHEDFQSLTTEARLLTHYKMRGMTNTLATGIRYFTGKMRRQGGGEGTTGSDFDLTLVDPAYEYDLSFGTTNIATFIENTFRFTDRLSVTPGIRYEYIRSTVKGYNPSEDEATVLHSDNSKNRYIFLTGVGAQYHITQTINVYGNWSQAYRPLDYSSLQPFATIVSVDPKMKDASGSNSDLGIRGSIKNFFDFDISGFYLQYNNRIGVKDVTDANGTHPLRTNIANSVHQGLESYIEFNPVRAFVGKRNWNISFFNSLALINAKYTSGEFNGKYVEYAPTSINRFGANVVIGKFSTTFVISNTAKSFGTADNIATPSSTDPLVGVIPAYAVMDWSGGVRFNKYNVKFGVNNLADARYFTLRTGEYPGPGIIPSIGRSAYISIGAKF